MIAMKTLVLFFIILRPSFDVLPGGPVVQRFQVTETVCAEAIIKENWTNQQDGYRFIRAAWCE